MRQFLEGKSQQQFEVGPEKEWPEKLTMTECMEGVIDGKAGMSIDLGKVEGAISIETDPSTLRALRLRRNLLLRGLEAIAEEERKLGIKD